MFGEYPHFDTRLPSSPANGNTMNVNGVTYTDTLPAGSTGGFHVVALNRRTLKPLLVTSDIKCYDLNLALPTNTAPALRRRWITVAS